MSMLLQTAGAVETHLAEGLTLNARLTVQLDQCPAVHGQTDESINDEQQI